MLFLGSRSVGFRRAKALIEQLDLTGITLVGHSMAGGEAVRYLTRHGRDRVKRLVLLAPMMPMLLKTDDNPGGAPREGFEGRAGRRPR